MSINKEIVDIDVDLEDLIPNFIQNRKNDIISLENFIKASDFSNIAQMAHRIKGVAAGYGFQRLSTMASDMEVLAKSEDISAISDIFPHMSTYFEGIDIHFV